MSLSTLSPPPGLSPSLHPAIAPALDGPIQANVLVAFCDCNRFMARTRGRTSADLFSELNALYALIDDVITSAGGLVIKFMGDAALVVFPEELADAGIMALLDLKTRVDGWLQEHRLGDSLQVNAHFAEATLGRMGRAGRLDVIGEAVTIAATLGSREFGLSQQAFRKLSAEHRKLFQRYTPPIQYRPISSTL